MTDHVRRLLDEVEACLDTEDAFAAFMTGLVAGPLARRHARAFWGDRMLTLDKSAGFLSDPRFVSAYSAIRGAHRYDQYDGPQTIAWRLHTLVWAARQALALPGDFVECGVFKGDMSWVVTEVVDFKDQARTFYLYDTFAGFADEYSSTNDFPDTPAFLAFAHQIYKDESIYASVVERFKNVPNVTIIRGIVPDVFAVAVPERVSYLHLDLNSPAAERGVLDALFDRMTPGAPIVLDDYGWHQFRPQKAGADAFFAARGHEVLELPTGQGLVIRR